MADHNYCDNENVLKFTEPSISDNYESKCVISMSDDPECGEVPKSGPQTRLKSKIKLEQSQSTWSPVRTAPGLRPNCTIFYDGNGFAYHNHKIANNKKYLKCTQKSIKKKPCPARAVIRNHDNMIRHSGEPHTHKPRNYDEDLLKRNFLMKIRERAINEDTPNRAIFDEEIKKTPKLRGKVTFSSTARRMQRFRQPQKMQGPLFPIEDNELIDAINDFKNIPHEESITNDNQECKPDITVNAENHNQECKPDVTVDAENHNQECKPDITFDAENHMEVIEIDDIDMESNEYTDEIESEAFNEKDDKENNENIKKEKDKTVNMFCCIYCNKWQEPQIFEFVPNQKSKTIELKENIEKKTVTSPIDCSSPVTIDNSSENVLNNNQTSTLEYSEIHEDISQNNDDNKDTCKQENGNVDASTDDPETANLETPELCESSTQEKKKKVERKLGFLQMRIDSTIYFDNMGYSYQIQNEKNDKNIHVY
uniref:FLYWCH-type domain-containing protein n=1 Tax=Schizaphis graminum TaxID=13262 RepID=A0A2S2PRH7_SCHGA